MSFSSRAAPAAACWLASTALCVLAADAPPADAPADPLPAGAVARLGSLRLRHVAGGLAWAPDGKTFASAGFDGTLRIWDAADGKEVRQFRGVQNGSLLAVLYLPGGKELAACGSDGAIHVWDEATGREARTILLPLQPTSRLAPGPEEGTLTAIGYDNVLRVVDLTTGKTIRQFEALRNIRPAVAAASPDGRRVAGWAGAPDDVLTVWDAADGKELIHVTTRLKPVSGLVFSPDGKTLAAFSGFQQLGAAWDVDTGKELRRYEGIGSPDVPTFSPNGKYLAGKGADRAIHVWGVASGKELRQFDVSSWNLPSGNLTSTTAFSPDGKRLAACLGASIHVWDVEADRDLHEFTGHVLGVDDLRFSPDGRRLLSCGREGAAWLWDVAAGKPIGSWNAPQAGTFVGVALPGGKSIITPSASGLMRIDLDGAKTAERVVVPPPAGINVFGLTPSPDGAALAGTGVDRILRVWDAKTGKETAQFPPGMFFGNPALAFSPDGRLLAEASINGPVHLWDVAARKEARQLDAGAVPAPGVFPAPGTPGQFRGVVHQAFTPDGRGLVCVTTTELSIWEVATGRDRLRAARQNANLTRVAVSPDGGLLAVGTSAGSVLVLDAVNGYELAQRAGGHGGAVTALAFTPDGKSLASGGADGGVVVWDVKEWAGKSGPAAADLKAERLPVLWKDLLDGDAGRAYKAVLTLSSAPKIGAPFLKDRLAGVEGGDEKRLAQLILNLNDDDFEVREKAQKDLEKLGEQALPALHKALESNPPAETRRRAQEVLDKQKSATAAAVTEEVRTLRAVEALERGGAAEALEALAKDAANGQVKQQAREALDRLGRRNSAP